MGREAEERTELRTRMPAKYQLVLAGVGVLAALVTTASAGQVWLGAGMVLVFAMALRMSARIGFEESGLHVRVAAVFSSRIAYRDIVEATAGPRTGFREGMGLRILPGGGTGYLVGGPTVRIRTTGTWLLVSCAEPEDAAMRIRGHIPA